MHRRSVLGLVAGIAIGAATAGCSSGAAGSSGQLGTSPVTITVQDQTSQETLFQQIANTFHAKYPNVSVQLETISQQQKTGSNLAVLGSNNPPDVGMIPIGSSVYTELIAANALVSLSGVFAADDLESRYGQAVADSLKVNGIPYTTPYSAVLYNVVWLNPNALKAAGLALPTDHRFQSVSQFIDYAKKLEAKGYGGFLLGGNSGFEASWMLDALLPSSATKEQMANYLTNYASNIPLSANYTDPAFVNVLTTLDQFNKAGIYQDGFLGQDALTALAPFLQGKAGMALGGNFTTSEFAKQPMSFTPDFAILPPVDNAVGSTALNSYLGDAIGIPAKASHIAWAKKFVEFVMSDDVQKGIIIDKQGLLPSVTSLSAENLTALPQLTQELLTETGKPNAGWTSTVPGAFGQSFLDPLIQQMYAGKLTPEQVARKMQENAVTYRTSNPATK